jgi:hypothetical protein
MRTIFLTSLLVSAVLASPAAASTFIHTVPGSAGAVTSRVAASRDGTYAVAWGAGKVAIRRSNGKWEPLRHLVASNRSGAGVDVAFDSHNRLIVTWVQSPSAPGHAIRGPFSVQAVTWTAGKKWGATHTLGHSGHFLAAEPRVVTDKAGDALIAWRGVRRNSSHQIRDCVSTSFRPSGGAFGSERHIADGGPSQDVELDAHGNAYAVWTHSVGSSSVNRFAHSTRGGAWSEPKTFSTSPSSLPVLAVLPGGGVVIGYRGAQPDSEGNGTQTGAIFTIARSASGVFGAPVKLSDGPAHEVNAAVSPAGEVTLSWGSPNGALNFSVRPPGGDPSPAQTSSELGFGPVAYASNEKAVVAFGDNHKEIKVSLRLPGDSAFGSPPIVLAGGGLYPALGIGGTQAAISWLDQAQDRLKLMYLSL